jgi:hypothetical protein
MIWFRSRTPRSIIEANFALKRLVCIFSPQVIQCAGMIMSYSSFFFGDSLTRASHASSECVDSLLPVVCVLDVISSSVRSATHKATRRGICAVVLLLAVLKIQLGH